MARLRDTFVDIFLNCPEVATIAATVSWKHDLNDANIQHGIWQGPNGPVTDAAGIIGSVHQTLRMLDLQCAKANELGNHLRSKVLVLGTDTVRRNEEIKKLEQDIARLTERRNALQADEAGA